MALLAAALLGFALGWFLRGRPRLPQLGAYVLLRVAGTVRLFGAVEAEHLLNNRLAEIARPEDLARIARA